MLLAVTRLILTLAVLFVGGCVTQPPLQPSADLAIHTAHLQKIAQINTFDIQGRLAVNANGKGYSGSIHWHHQENTDSIDVYTPLGSKIAHIEKTATQVTLTNAKGEQITAQDVESLTEKTLGWRLPLSGLNDWAVGRPTPAPITHQSWDAMGRLTKLEQQEWQITYLEYTDNLGASLPQKITLRHPTLLLKLVVEQWSPAPPSSTLN
ncbi:MAG: outer membrane lipoprotein LolB [Methylophilaceae bacterium 17-44-8]|jgi:outer membrane lipoprotein LolB|nr:MAG: outer membrane lipoprotein LolB [Methylophilales bacterium 28-44-11]OYY97066.1 MAG: outer membrane lipoprotein LolB [Methylophilales bacterium 16-45-7]OZA06745.1 MAG: outer membrane lipoprotein LolB [Methylophilaceae bacterium 17-44-8]